MHGSTPHRRLATSAVTVALAKAAQAGFPRRGRPRPRKPGSSFGRRAPLVGLGHKSHRTHRLKGIVPEVAAHVSVLLGVACVGGGVAQPHASTAASTAPVERTLMSSSAGHGRSGSAFLERPGSSNASSSCCLLSFVTKDPSENGVCWICGMRCVQPLVGTWS